MADVEFLVIGAGAAGLGAARELAARGRDVLLVDPEARVGGVMQSERVRGYLVEAGPNTFRLSASLVEFVERIGVSGILRPAAPASRERFLLRGGQLRPVPMGPGAFLATPLLSARGKLRLLAEPFLRRGDATGESVAAFLARRLGAEVVDALVGPFLTGVYAGDEAQLGAEAVFPSLTELERRYGSLALGGIRSAWAGRGGRTARGRPGTWSAADGAAGLAAALAAGLSTPPRLETRAVSLRREGDAWRVVLRGPGGEEEVRAAGVVVATPAPEAAELLGNVDADAAALLAKIEYAPIVTVALGADPARTLRPIRGFGFLVPRGENVSILGCLFMSQLFPGRAPEGRELLHCMLGGKRWPAAFDLPDDELEKRVRLDLDRVLGLRHEPETVRIHRWPRAIPQPGTDHVQRVAEVRRRIPPSTGLALAGAHLDGIALGDAVVSGVRAAATLMEARQNEIQR